MAAQIRLYGKVFITGEIRADTGLHIGGGDAGIEIGGMDNPVIKNARTNEPYIPGSSLKGKMRSLSEKVDNRPQNSPIQNIYIHVCDDRGEYANCDVCHIFGVPGNRDFSSPTRLSVRDVRLDASSLEGVGLTEGKWEASIDRITSAAVPRQLERVPEGAVFSPFEFCYSVYKYDDIERLRKVFRAMQLVEDDYLGGSGTRGSGKIKFENMQIGCRPGNSYGDQASPTAFGTELLPSMEHLLEGQGDIVDWLREQLLGSESHE